MFVRESQILKLIEWLSDTDKEWNVTLEMSFLTRSLSALDTIPFGRSYTTFNVCVRTAYTVHANRFILKCDRNCYVSQYPLGAFFANYVAFIAV